MAYFTQAQVGTLFVGQPNAGAGFVTAVFPTAPPAAEYEIADVLGTTTAGATLNASIVFLQQNVPSDAAGQKAFVDAVTQLIAAQSPARRVIAWATSPADVAKAAVAAIGPGGGTSVNLTSALSLYGGASPITITIPGDAVASQQVLTATDTGLKLTWAYPPIFSGIAATAYPNLPITIPFSGPNAFCLQLLLSVTQTALDLRGLGFSFATAPPPPAPPEQLEVRLYAPLTIPDGRQTPLFNASFDPLDLLNTKHRDRTILNFYGPNLESTTTVFTSTYATQTGRPILLTPIVSGTALPDDTPGGLVFSLLQYRNNGPTFLTLNPEGDFELSLPAGATQAPWLLCGLQGMEYLTFTPATGKTPGDRLRFVSGSPAYAPMFPFPLASPTAAPFDPLASPLTTNWVTSYAMLRQPSTGSKTVLSVAQPPGFQLFGEGGGTVSFGTHPNLLGSYAPGTQVKPAPTSPFPLVPYQKVQITGDPLTMTASQVNAVEAGILAPLRSVAIARDSEPPLGTVTTTFVTPAGYLVSTKCSSAPPLTAVWTQILLGTVGSDSIAFNSPDATLVSAFSTGSLMLVIANTSHTGAFANALTLDQWKFQAKIGNRATFGNYTNVVIVKGMPGALATLVQNPANWTNAATFAAPDTGNGPDTGQLVNLAQWLQNYIAQAAAVTGPDATYFSAFNSIVTDVNWTGVLILRADITGVPPDIVGILAGITDYSHFNLHHLAIPIVPASVPPAPKPSPVSGLIYYNPFPGADSTQAVPTDPTATYGFQLNSLKVTFQNSAVQTFSSYAQITLRNLLGSAVTASSAGDDSVVLTGTYQLINSQPVYSMASTSLTTLTLDCAVLPTVGVTGVQMATVQTVAGGNTVSVFAIVGFLDFAVAPGNLPNPGGIDLFSFGHVEGGPPGGLTFQNVVLTMTFPTPPAGQPSTDKPTFTLANNALRFDQGTSQLRPISLVNELSLQVTGLLVQQTATPGDQGYLPVIAMFPAGNLSPAYNALLFNLDMGTPGQLAAKAGLTASLMLAWNPTTNTPTKATPGAWDVQVGLQLPGTGQGAPLISLQTVLHLSIGQVGLQYASSVDGSHSGFLLMLDEIAISFLGLLKFPPNGATSFYLFGDPSGAGKSLGWYARYLNSGDKA